MNSTDSSESTSGDLETSSGRGKRKRFAKHDSDFTSGGGSDSDTEKDSPPSKKSRANAGGKSAAKSQKSTIGSLSESDEEPDPPSLPKSTPPKPNKLMPKVVNTKIFPHDPVRLNSAQEKSSASGSNDGQQKQSTDDGATTQMELTLPVHNITEDGLLGNDPTDGVPMGQSLISY